MRHAMQTQSRRAERSLLKPLLRELPRILDDLANMSSAKRFRRRLAPFFDSYSDQDLKGLRDELRMLWTGEAPVSGDEPSVTAAAMLRSFRELPANVRQDVSLQEFIVGRWLRRSPGGGLMMWWERGKPKLYPDPHELPAILAWGVLLHYTHLRICRNSGCSTRYFVAARRDQKYCSDLCAAPAKREAKLRWWEDHKQVLLQKRKQQRSKSQAKGRAQR
jgi:hypothetical protein